MHVRFLLFSLCLCVFVVLLFRLDWTHAGRSDCVAEWQCEFTHRRTDVASLARLVGASLCSLWQNSRERGNPCHFADRRLIICGYLLSGGVDSCSRAALLLVLAGMLEVGLIGLGPEWEGRFRPALLNLRHRMRARVLQSAVISLADQTAADLQCEAAYGLLSVMERPDVRALLILDTAWYGTVPAEFACRVGKPAFLAGRLTEWIPRAREILPLAAESGTTLMPDFGHRYTPATSRLKELIATRLGRPDSVIVHTSVRLDADSAPIDGLRAAVQDAWLESLDWACHLAGTAPAEVRCSESEFGPGRSASEISIGFRRSAAGGAPATARVTLEQSVDGAPAWSAEVRCRKGIARLQGDTQIDWEDASEKRSESLVGERRDVEVMLDHFSRRVVGGLIPVPTLDDLWLAVRLLEVAERSRQMEQAQAFE